MDTGQIIRLIREQKNMSQEELAKKLGYSGRAMISHIELGKRGIDFTDIDKWAAALGVDQLALMGRGDYFKEYNELIEKIQTDPQMQEIIKKIYKLPEEKLTLLNGLLDSWLV